MSKSKITGMTTIKMTYKAFLKEFNPSFTAIANLPANSKSGKLKYAIKRTLACVQNLGETHSKKAREICEPFAELNENGNPKMNDDGSYVWSSKDDRLKAEKGMEKLNDTSVDLQVYPIHLSTLTDAHKISVALEINLGEFIVENADLNIQIIEDEKVEKKNNNN